MSDPRPCLLPASGCVCGFNPPNEPNSDCERCMLVTTIAWQNGEIEKGIQHLAAKDAEIERLREAMRKAAQALKTYDDVVGADQFYAYFCLQIALHEDK